MPSIRKTRPPSHSNTGVLFVRIDRQLKERLSVLAARRACFKTFIVNEALRAYLTTEETRTASVRP
jgi:predicted transcriptional regulator